MASHIERFVRACAEDEHPPSLTELPPDTYVLWARALATADQDLLERVREGCGEEDELTLKPLHKHVNRIALYYNGLGQMLAFKAVDPALLLGTGGYRAREAWAVLEPYILAERAVRGESYLSNFEHLVVVATETPWAASVRKLGLRRFDRYPADVGRLAVRPAGHEAPKPVTG